MELLERVLTAHAFLGLAYGPVCFLFIVSLSVMCHHADGSLSAGRCGTSPCSSGELL